jgi:hypothetical protein
LLDRRTSGLDISCNQLSSFLLSQGVICSGSCETSSACRRTRLKELMALPTQTTSCSGTQSFLDLKIPPGTEVPPPLARFPPSSNYPDQPACIEFFQLCFSSMPALCSNSILSRATFLVYLKYAQQGWKLSRVLGMLGQILFILVKTPVLGEWSQEAKE